MTRNTHQGMNDRACTVRITVRPLLLRSAFCLLSALESKCTTLLQSALAEAIARHAPPPRPFTSPTARALKRHTHAGMPFAQHTVAPDVCFSARFTRALVKGLVKPAIYNVNTCVCVGIFYNMIHKLERVREKRHTSVCSKFFLKLLKRGCNYRRLYDLISEV